MPELWAELVLRARANQRDDLVGRARAHVDSLSDRGLDLLSAVVFGSVARGDFNDASDVDLLVIAAELSDNVIDRCRLLNPGCSPRVECLGWMPDELRRQSVRRNLIVIEALADGVFLAGEAEFRTLVGASTIVGAASRSSRSNPTEKPLRASRHHPLPGLAPLNERSTFSGGERPRAPGPWPCLTDLDPSGLLL